MGLLIRVVYLSEVNIASGDLLPQLRAIHDVSTHHNREADISGVLLFSHRFFVQLLEGPRLRVTETLGRILADHRHDNIRLCLAREVHAPLLRTARRRSPRPRRPPPPRPRSPPRPPPPPP